MLLQSALWQTAPKRTDFSDSELNEIMRLAEKHALTALIFDVINENNINMNCDMAISYFARCQQTKAMNTSVIEDLQKLTGFLDKRNIKYVVFKGQTVAALYPKPLLRACGDIDFYVAQKSQNELKEQVSSRFSIEEDSVKHLGFRSNKADYEMHYITAVFNYPPHQKYWNKIVEKDVDSGDTTISVMGKDVRIFSPTVNAVYLFIHIYHHLLKEGIGLRQFCDWALFLKSNKEKIDKEQLCKILDKLGYKKAYRTLGCILTEKLGLPAEYFPFELSAKDYKRSKSIWERICNDGNFGKGLRKIQKAGWLRSLETAKVSFSHFLPLINLTPLEVLLFLPSESYRSIMKNIYRIQGKQKKEE